jgi:VWFA-related protein
VTFALRTRIALTLSLWCATSFAQDKAPEFPSSVELVTVDVVVKDKKGKPVTGLRPEDFTILEDGKPQKVVGFEQVETASQGSVSGSAEESSSARPSSPTLGTTPNARPRVFVVVFDQVHLTSPQADTARRALRDFLRETVRANDKLRLVAVGGWEFEGPPEAVRDELDRLEGQFVPDKNPETLTDYEAMRIDRFDDWPLMMRVIERWAILNSGRRTSDREGERINTIAAEDLAFKNDEGYVKIMAKGVYGLALRRNLTTLRAMKSEIERLASVRGRKSLILVSPGLINDSHDEGFRRVVDAANGANTAIYFLDVRGLEPIPLESAEQGPMLPSIDLGYAMADVAQASQGSELLAADTGGFSVKHRNDLASGFRQIADEAGDYYLLGYSPPSTPPSETFRKIQVKVRRSGLEVRARKGYFAGPSRTARSGQPEPDGPIGLRTAAYVFGDAGGGKLRTLVAADADLAGLTLETTEGAVNGSVDLAIVVTGADGAELDRYVQQVDIRLSPARRKALEARGLPLAHFVDLPPGAYEARIALSDRASGRAGAISHRFEVPAGGFRFSTPILSDVMEPGVDANKDAPAIGARRAFRERRTLYFQYEVYGARPDPRTGEPAVISGWTIRDRAGTEWAAAEPARLRTSGDRVPGRLEQVDITFPPGEYTLVLDARDQLSTQRVEIREPFTVEAARP